ncbi:hypothetical protein NJH78_05260 [Pseudomonas chlororaphis]|uniref:hypothetical protein n=1 Tax=Pseudomonas chlororaphis TaxID=587753 RepID=UPI00209B72DF|nr:hypothetical protein [Pseudomonas chlororaphis]MCO7569374.1 hypothetical protein [Pseudomonas chlororaphis]MCO7586781.1 hypothetical protein [Pseudomonas chlororaphis]
MAGPKTVASIAEVIVAPGRTVKGVDKKVCGPGEVVRVPSEEVAGLIALGFLADGAAVEKKQVGPHISVSAGPTVRIA